jgi:hypothetical protein
MLFLNLSISTKLARQKKPQFSLNFTLFRRPPDKFENKILHKKAIIFKIELEKEKEESHVLIG